MASRVDFTLLYFLLFGFVIWMELAYKPGISTGHGVVVPAYSELLVKSPLPVETGWWLISEQIKYGTYLSADLLECYYLTYFSFLSLFSKGLLTELSISKELGRAGVSSQRG
jgi:hypothetical protein